MLLSPDLIIALKYLPVVKVSVMYEVESAPTISLNVMLSVEDCHCTLSGAIADELFAVSVEVPLTHTKAGDELMVDVLGCT